jgi:hypothetical protein
MKELRFAAFLAGALAGACPAAASPAGDIGGTWECRQPGVQYRNKPPILYVADSGSDRVTIEVDGFAREMYGRSEVFADADGWFRVKPAQGQEFLIRPQAQTKEKTASMGLSFADGKTDYRCLRLPPSAATTFAPSGTQGAPATEGVLVVPAEPAAEPSPAPAAEPSAPQPGMPSEGAGKKAY